MFILLDIKNKKTANHFCRIFTKEVKDNILNRRMDIRLETHFLCGIAARYRNFLRR